MLSGTYLVGYEINNKKYFRLQVGQQTLIGASFVILMMRSQIVVKTKSALRCFAIRKSNYHRFIHKFPEFQRQLTTRIFNQYQSMIHTPLMSKK